jgi:hypothetical protein
MAPLPLGYSQKDYFNKKSRESLINMIAEVDGSGNYAVVRRLEGLTKFIDTTFGSTRSDLFFNSGFVYFVSGDNFFRVNSAKTVENLGAIGGAGRCKIAANNFPGDNQLIILNGSGNGFTFKNADGLEAIVSPNFFLSSSVTVLFERAWLVRDGTGEIFGSAVADFKTYDPLTFINAEESPDNAVAVTAKKGIIYVLGERTTQLFQSIDDTTLPLRSIPGSTIQEGIIAVNSLSDYQNSFFWLADDLTVVMASDGQMKNISHLAMELEIKGDGTLQNQGYTIISDAVGFFSNGPVHKIYYLSFVSQGVTWGYDLSTGIWHKRSSGNTGGLYRGNGSVNAFNLTLVGDEESGKIFVLDANSKTEDGETVFCTFTLPSVSRPYNFTLPLIEFDMEVGVGLPAEQNQQRLMQVQYSKDGGYNYTNHSDINLGSLGNYRKRVPIRQLGRTVRYKDFILRLIITDPIDFRVYGAWGDFQESVF